MIGGSYIIFLRKTLEVTIVNTQKMKKPFTLYRPMFPSYRNQLVDLQSKSTDWFQYDENIDRSRIHRKLHFLCIGSLPVLCVLPGIHKHLQTQNWLVQ